MDDQLPEVAAALRYEHGTPVDLAERTLVVANPVTGDPGAAVLRVLGLAQAASPVGAAAAGATGVAIGVWRAPELYLARWTRGKRWVVGFRLTGGARLSDYIGMEGRVPTRLETGNWYAAVPDAVEEAFLEVGLLVDDPPFPVPRPAVPAAPPPRPASSSPGANRAPRRAATSVSGASASGGSRSRATPAAAARKPQTSNRLCPSCRMHKAVAQFVPDSDLCVDCR